MSISVVGVAKRSFIIGMRLCHASEQFWHPRRHVAE